MVNKIFGWQPSPRGFKPWVYNSVCGVGGAALYADTFYQFVGLVLIIEAVLMSIERCWPKEERP